MKSSHNPNKILNKHQELPKFHSKSNIIRSAGYRQTQASPALFSFDRIVFPMANTFPRPVSFTSELRGAVERREGYVSAE